MTALGIVLLIVGLALLVAEAHLPAAGALGVAGVAAAVVGASLLALEAGIGLALALPVAAGAGVAGAGLLLVATRKAATAGRLPVRAGAEKLVGRVAVVCSPPAPVGQVLVDGERWRARRAWEDEVDGALAEGDRVVIESVDGLTVSVRRAEEWELPC